MLKILLVEDQPKLARILQYDLEQANFFVTTVHTAQAAKSLLSEQQIFDIYLLDWMLPDESGIKLASHLRKINNQAHIIMLTAKAEELDKIEAFQAGVDDYLTKPFSTRELIARIKAYETKEKNRQKQTNNPSPIIHYKELTIFPEQMLIKINDTQKILTLKEYELLRFFLEHKGKVISRNQLLERIWGYDYDGQTRTIDVFVHKLRTKIENQSTIKLKTIRGIGYMFE